MTTRNAKSTCNHAAINHLVITWQHMEADTVVLGEAHRRLGHLDLLLDDDEVEAPDRVADAHKVAAGHEAHVERAELAAPALRREAVRHIVRQ